MLFSKRGQVTLFVIIAIIVVALVVLFLLYIKPNFIDNKVSPEIRPVQEYFQECLKLSSERAILFIGAQGGFLNPNLAIKTTSANIGYWLYESRDIRPTKEEMERDISAYVYYTLPICLNSFVDLTKKGYEIQEDADKIILKTSLGEDAVSIKATYPLMIKKDSTKAKISDFSVKIPVRFLRTYDQASKIIEIHKQGKIIDSKSILEPGFDLGIMQYSDVDYIYVLTDNNSRILNQSFTLMFAAR